MVMKTKTMRLLILALLSGLILVFQSCEEDDDIRSGSRWCTEGIDVEDIDESLVPSEARALVDSRPERYIGVGHPSYTATKKVILIPFEFATEFPRNTFVDAALIRQELFASGTGSVRDYFTENSYGQFDLIEGAISNWVKLSKDPADYKGSLPDWPTSPDLHRELCQKSGTPWWDYDTNGDHIIDIGEAAVCFMPSVGQLGCNRSSDAVVQTNRGVYTISQWFVFFDCKRTGEPDSGVDAIRYNIPTICHEFCHGLFRLPDRYRDYSGSGTTGQYDIMSDNGSIKMMNMYDRMKLGWIRLKILEKPVDRPDGERHCYRFFASETNSSAVVLFDRHRPDQYWIVENRYKPGSSHAFDNGLPESGLAAWWVNGVDDKVYLVDANDPMKHPQTYMYSAGPPYTGALFKGDEMSEPGKVFTTYLSSSSGDLSFLLRGVSPPGMTVYVEF